MAKKFIITECLHSATEGQTVCNEEAEGECGDPWDCTIFEEPCEDTLGACADGVQCCCLPQVNSVSEQNI